MMIGNDTNALFYPFTKGVLSYPAANSGGRGLFVNAAFCPELKDKKTGLKTFLQHDFIQAFTLTKAGFPVISEWPGEEEDPFDMVLIRLPKQRDQAHYFMARGLALLKEGGTMICAAANDAGGGRIEKDLRQLLSGQPVFSLSKYKARVVWGQKTTGGLSADIMKDWWEKGGLQKHSNHGFWTQPGIFGWDKIDKGSAMLLTALPEDLQGIGADFGCGYGYLSVGLCNKNKKITELYCIDSDRNAIKAARKNLEEEAHLATINMVWDDLTAPVTDITELDFIVMNPPFHDGKKEDAGIGIKFIETAAKMLRKNGTLWMVANSHLPYEKTIESLFSRYENVLETQGFKIYCAVK